MLIGHADMMGLGWQVAPGDVVVAGSDGLWDNLSQADIQTRVRSCLKKACPCPCTSGMGHITMQQPQWSLPRFIEVAIFLAARCNLTMVVWLQGTKPPMMAVDLASAAFEASRDKKGALDRCTTPCYS